MGDDSATMAGPHCQIVAFTHRVPIPGEAPRELQQRVPLLRHVGPRKAMTSEPEGRAGFLEMLKSEDGPRGTETLAPSSRSVARREA